MNNDPLLEPGKLWCADELFGDPELPPPHSGVYAWYFDRAPRGEVPLADCHAVGGWTLLYVGISPARANSKQNLRKRLRQHFRGNARGSTLRKTLGCLLQEELLLEYRRISTASARFTSEGEARLSQWMADHARVAWATTPEPWIVEDQLIQRMSLPLNMKGNETHPFYRRLAAMRKAMTKGA